MFPFQVVDIGPYQGKGKRLVEDLKNFKPDVLMLGWCWSRSSDVTLWLRMEGHFSYMMLRHDLQVVTGRQEAKPDKVQREIIETLGIQLFTPLSLIMY